MSTMHVELGQTPKDPPRPGWYFFMRKDGEDLEFLEVFTEADIAFASRRDNEEDIYWTATALNNISEWLMSERITWDHPDDEGST